MCLEMDIVVIKLQLGDAETAKTMLESANEQLKSVKPSESVIFSKYYKATAEYRKVKQTCRIYLCLYTVNIFYKEYSLLCTCACQLKVVGPANEFYSAALMYLSYTSVEELSAEAKYTLATDMALASITGDDIYNFGDVLATPILTSLKDTPNEWLLHVVETMNAGNVEQFGRLVEAHRAQYFAQPALAAKHDSVVRQKIVLLCLVNVAFERPSHERLIAFSDIAARASIPLDQV